MRLCWIACALLLTPPVLAADAWEPANRLNAWLDGIAKAQRFSASIAVVEKGRLRYQRSVGFARIGNIPEPADAGTRYRLGSVSRLFTAVLVMQEVEKASITLDTPVAEFYADVPNALAITYRDLLQERSGLADYAGSTDFETWRLQPRTHPEMLALVVAGGTQFEPRARVEPVGTNYLLLGYVLEKVRERPYEELLRRSIDSLGLARTYFAGTGRSSLESFAYRATPSGWESVPASDPSVLGGAGGVVSNAGDLAQYVEAMFGGRLLSAQSLATLLGADGGPGIVLHTRRLAHEDAFCASGGGDGFTAAVCHFPAQQLAVAFTSNYSTVPADAVVEQVFATAAHRGHEPALP